MSLHILVTGAGGFVGAALAARLQQDHANGLRRFDSLTLLDRQWPATQPDGHAVQRIEGDITDPAVLAQAVAPRPNLVFHLAGITSRQAEADVALGLAVNVQASIALLEHLRQQGQGASLVFTSSIGVFGAPLPACIDDDTPAVPALSYGAQKKMVETLVADYSRRGFVRGLSLRLPGIVTRPGAPGAALSAFASDLLRELAAGRPFTCPVAANATMWWMSLATCVDNLVRAAALTWQPQLPASRALNLPALRASVADLVDALARRHGPALRARIRYQPDAALQAQFANWPPLATPQSDRLGLRHDGDLATLLARALQPA